MLFSTSTLCSLLENVCGSLFSICSSHELQSRASDSEAEPYWKRNLAICVFGSFTTLFSLTLLLPFLPVYVEQLGISSKSSIVEWTGLCFGATFLGTGLTAPLWGHLGDRYGRKKMLVRAAVGMTLVIPMLGLVRNVYQLAALRLLAGLVGGYSSSSTQLVAAQAPRDRAAWALGILSTGSLAGNLLGPLLGGILPGYIGIRNTFFAAGAVIAVAMIATVLFVKETRSGAASLSRTTHAQSGDKNKVSTFVLATILGTAMMVLFANMSIEPIITLYLRTFGGDHGRDVLHAGFVMSAAAFGSILAAPRLGRLADRIGPWKVIQRCLLVTALLLVPQAFVTHWWQLLALRFLMGMSLVGLLPSIAKLIRSTASEAALGRTLGLSQSAQYAGQVLGPIVGGFVGAHLGMRAVFPATSAILLLVTWMNHKASPRAVG